MSPPWTKRFIQQLLNQRTSLYGIRLMRHAAHKHLPFIDKRPNVLLRLREIGDTRLSMSLVATGRRSLSHAGCLRATVVS